MNALFLLTKIPILSQKSVTINRENIHLWYILGRFFLF